MSKKILVVFLVFIAFSNVVAATSDMILQPEEEIQIQAGEPFTIRVFVEPNHVIDTVAIDRMTWDEEVLECTSMQQGNLFQSSLVWITGEIGTGNISGMCWGSQYETDDPNYLANFTFMALQNGSTVISLDEVGIARAGEPMTVDTHDVRVIVGDGVKPVVYEPTDVEISMPIFLVAALVILAVIVVSYFTVKKGQMGKDPKK